MFLPFFWLCSEEMEGAPLLLWPYRDIKPSDAAFVAANRLAIRGARNEDPRAVDFGVEKNSAAALQKWAKLKMTSVPDIERKSPTDADGDGIPDLDDALLFTPNEPIVFEIDSLNRFQ